MQKTDNIKNHFRSAKPNPQFAENPRAELAFFVHFYRETNRAEQMLTPPPPPPPPNSPVAGAYCTCTVDPLHSHVF
jgi:hypothetical protein